MTMTSQGCRLAAAPGCPAARQPGADGSTPRSGTQRPSRGADTGSAQRVPAWDDRGPRTRFTNVRTSLRQSRPGPGHRGRIPPGQYRTEKFPVLHYGSVPHTDLATWDFRVWGEVDSPFTLTWDQFKALPRKTVATDIHCVTRWSKLDTAWEGVADPDDPRDGGGSGPTATHVVSHAEQGYTANLPLSVLDDDDVLLADTFDGEPLELEHGYPLRLLVPKKYFWKSSKWVRGLEFLDHDQLGFWERYGYHNDADPWREERFSE